MACWPPNGRDRSCWTSPHPRPADTIRLAALAAEHGRIYLDAGMSGGAAGAEAGRLTLMMGGQADAIAQCHPVLDAIASAVFHVGAVGGRAYHEAGPQHGLPHQFPWPCRRAAASPNARAWRCRRSSLSSTPATPAAISASPGFPTTSCPAASMAGPVWRTWPRIWAWRPSWRPRWRSHLPTRD